MGKKQSKPSSKPKRTLVRLSVGIVVLAGLAFGVQTSVASVYAVPMASMEPELPSGSRVLVYKLADSFRVGQIVAYRHSTGQTYLGRVEGIQIGALLVSRNGTEPTLVSERDVIGRVIMNTR